jgi:hypothetical protein
MLNQLGRYRETVDLGERAITAHKRVFGIEDPHTLIIMGVISEAYFRLRNNNIAINLEEKVVEGHERVLGKQHPRTQASMRHPLSMRSEKQRQQKQQ